MISTQTPANWLQLINQSLQAWIHREIIDFDPYDLEAIREQQLMNRKRI